MITRFLANKEPEILSPSALQLEPECAALFAELLRLRGILFWPSSLQLEPESFAELLQLRGILLWPSSLQLEPDCNVQHVSRSCYSCAAFYFGIARSNLSLNAQHFSQSYFPLRGIYFGPARSNLSLNVQQVSQSCFSAARHSTSA